MLFAAVAVARFAGIDPEEALNEASDKYIDRFSYIDRSAQAQGKAIEDMTLGEMMQLWEKAKETHKG